MAVQFAFGKIVTNGLVLALDAADRNSYVSGSTIWNDVSGNGNNGTLTNGPTFSNNSIVFDGVDDYCQTATNSITNNSSFSLSCWFSITILNGIFRPIIDGGSLNSGTLGYCLAINNSNRIYVASNAGYVEISNSISTNTWYNIVGTAQFGTPYLLNVYINGVLGTPNTSATTNALTNNSSFIRLGQSINGTNRLPGSVGVAQIYNRPLSATEILQNYNALKSRFGL
jgi:hypothetical protein